MFALTMKNAQTIKAQFYPGDIVQAQDPHSLLWRRAQVDRFVPYKGKEGYYILWRDNPPPYESQGGWSFLVKSL